MFPLLRQRELVRRSRALVAVTVFVTMCLGACSKPLPYHARGAVKRSYEHDDAAFTQGLAFDNGFLYESTGLHGQSSLRRVDLESGEVLQMERLPDHLFGEGCTVWGDTIVQLTWRAGTGFVYNKASFAVERRFTYEGEGWGLTHDRRQLIMSDGTSYLRFLDPVTLEETSRVQVIDKGRPVARLNELEWVDGQVWANVWPTADIVRVDPGSGQVLGWIDLSELASSEPHGVLNGIVKRGRQILVTGKRWTAIYEIEIRAADQEPHAPSTSL